MKKSIFSYFSYLILALLAVGTLSSCGETEGTGAAPTVSINPTSATIDVGQTVDFTYNVVSSEGKLEEIRIISRNVTRETITDFTNNNSHSGSFVFTGVVDDAGTTVTVTIEAVDKDGNRGSSSVDITVNEAVDPVAIEGFSAILLGAQNNSSTGSFLDANTGTVYKIADARSNSALIDMAYLQGSQSNGQGAVIGSLRDASVEAIFSTNGWTTRSDTRFRNTSLTPQNFDAITDGSEITAAYSGGSEPNIGSTGDPREGATSRVNKLAANTVFAFKTADGKDGVAKIVSVDAGESGSIRLDVKIVK